MLTVERKFEESLIKGLFTKAWAGLKETLGDSMYPWPGNIEGLLLLGVKRQGETDYQNFTECSRKRASSQKLWVPLKGRNPHTAS